MFSAPVFTALFVLAAPLIARADVSPSEPAPAEIFNAGSTCHIAWDGDASSTTAWKSMTIQLMTGDNFNMVALTTVATNQDGTASGTFDYTCPEVTPNSAIYFYQFTAPAAANTTWTGRFAIASDSGATTTPTNATQPGGAAIPWGTGALTDPSKAVAAPSSGTGAATTSPTVTGAATTTAAAVVTTRLSTSVISTASVAPSSTTSSVANTTTNNNAASGALGVAAPSGARLWLGAAALLVAAAAW